jgi:hypothetical protein
MNTNEQATQNDVIREIALRVLHIQTLEVQNNDRLDFHDLSVETILAALNQAYEAGRTAGTASGNAP